MLFFRSEDEVQAWGKARNLTLGETLSLEQLWVLSVRWYGNRLDRDFHGRSLEQAEAIFREVGLNSAFWKKI